MNFRPVATTILGILSLALLGSASEGDQDIFYPPRTAADAELAQFDRAHPECQLWTNWQKMCSRTGPSGATLCRATAQSKVRPSAPFCTAKEDGGYRRPNEDDGVRALRSSLRFCSYPNGKPSGLAAQVEACEFLPTRPFGGHDLRDQVHPWCDTWKEAGRVRPASVGRRPRYGFFCSVQRVPSWCVWPDGLGYGPVKAAPSSAPKDVPIQTLLNPDSIAVRGIFCRRKGK
jgi:hypothetical protein